MRIKILLTFIIVNIRLNFFEKVIKFPGGAGRLPCILKEKLRDEVKKIGGKSLKAASVGGSGSPTTIENSGYSLIFEQICKRISSNI